MVALSNGNPSTTIISSNNPTNANDEINIMMFYNELSFLVRSIPKHNVLIIGGHINAQTGQHKTKKFSLHNLSHRNGEHLIVFTHENRLICFDNKFQKREGKLWSYTNSNKALIDYIVIKKNGLIVLWTVRHIPLLNEYVPITELSQQRCAWACAEIRHKKVFCNLLQALHKFNTIRHKEPKPLTMTGPHLMMEIIIIIMSCWLHGYPWPYLATFPYRSSPLAGLLGYIPYAHIVAECMFVLVVLLLLGHMWGSIRVHPLWVRPCFSNRVLHVWFV